MMQSLRGGPIFAAILGVSAGCATICRVSREQLLATAKPEIEQTTPPAAGVTHVVLVWLKQPGDAEARKALIGASQQLRSIPGVVDVQAGAVLPSTRPTVDSTFDVGIVMTFTDEQALRAYATHPNHLKLVDEVLKPSADRYKVYDFRDGE